VVDRRNFVANAFAVAPVQALEEKGFVRFKRGGDSNNTTKTSSIIIVSEHIRAKLPDPLSHYASKKPAPIVAKSSADSLREELAKIRAERDSQTPAVQAVPRKRAAPPPPPQMSFAAPRRKKR
jgi:vacuolar-type H+-ATPase subunit F/Vma7